MKKFKINFCSLECTGVRYFTPIKFGTLRSAKKVMSTLEKEGYEVHLYRLKKGGTTDLDYELIDIAT